MIRFFTLALASFSFPMLACAETTLNDRECAELAQLTRQCKASADHYQKTNLLADAGRFRECEKGYFTKYREYCLRREEKAFFDTIAKNIKDSPNYTPGSYSDSGMRIDPPSPANNPGSSGGGGSSNLNASEIIGIAGDLFSLAAGVYSLKSRSGEIPSGSAPSSSIAPRSPYSGISRSSGGTTVGPRGGVSNAK